MPFDIGTFTFDRPETIDDATFSRIVFIRPLELAVQPIIDHNVELIHAVRRMMRRKFHGKRRKFHER